MKVLINGNLGFSLHVFYLIRIGAVLPSAEDIASSADMPPGNLLTALSSSTDACLWGKVSRSLLNQFQITAVNSPRTIPSSRNVRGTELAQKYRLIYE